MQLKKAKFLSFILAVVFMLCTSMITSCSSPSGSDGGGSSSSSSSGGSSGSGGAGGAGAGGAGGSGGGGTTTNPYASITNPITLDISVPANTQSLDVIRRRVNENHSTIQGEDWKMIASYWFEATASDYATARSKTYKDYYEVVNGYYYEYKMNVRTGTNTNGTETSLGYHQATYAGLQAPDLKTTDNAYPEIHFDSQNGRKMKLLNKDSIAFTFHNSETMNNWTLTMHYNYFNYCAWFNGSKDIENISDEAWNKFTSGDNKMNEFYIKIQFQNEEYARVFYKDPASLNHQKIDEKIWKEPEVNLTNKTVSIRVRLQPNTRDLAIQRRFAPVPDNGWPLTQDSFDSTETVGYLSSDQFDARKIDNDYLEFVDKYGLENDKVYQYRYVYRSGNDFTLNEMPLGTVYNAALAPTDGRTPPSFGTAPEFSWAGDSKTLTITNETSVALTGGITGEIHQGTLYDINIGYVKRNEQNEKVGGFYPIFKLKNNPAVSSVTVAASFNYGLGNSSYTIDADNYALVIYDDAGVQHGHGGIAHYIKLNLTILGSDATQQPRRLSATGN